MLNWHLLAFRYLDGLELNSKIVSKVSFSERITIIDYAVTSKDINMFSNKNFFWFIVLLFG